MTLDRLEKHFSPVAGKALERYGFAYGEMIANWAAIVGDDLASVSAPERVRWPRGSEVSEGRGRGGVLVVAAEAGHAIDVQSDSERIIERINGYYGYEAISALKVHQTRLDRPRPNARRPKAPDPEAERRLDARLDAIADDHLKAALRRLGHGVLAGKDNSGEK